MLLASVYQGYIFSCASSVDSTPTLAELLATLSSFALIIEASVDFGVDFKEIVPD